MEKILREKGIDGHVALRFKVYKKLVANSCNARENYCVSRC